MAEMPKRKERQPFLSRVLYPAGVPLVAWILLNFLTDHLEWFGIAYRPAAFTLYLLLGLTIALSSLFVYSLMYARGASTKERALWSFVVPLAWLLKEIWRVSAFFTPGESFYYALSPLPLGLLVFQLIALCLCEIFWRWRYGKDDPTIRVWTPGPVAGLVISAILLYFMALWGNPGDTPGTKWFYLYMEGYKALFL